VKTAIGNEPIMKILLAINSEKNHKSIANQSLRLAGRVGYEFRLFTSLKEHKKYVRAIEEANYHWYLGILRTSVISGQTMYHYAERNGIDLILNVPDNLEIPVDKKAEQRYVIAFCKKVEKYRQRFESGQYKNRRQLGAGVVMERVN
jgi:hypothetical protein